METINGLLKALDNKVPASIARRLDGLNKLSERLEIAKGEHEANPTEKSKDDLDEIIQFISDTEEDLKDDLSILVDKKRDVEAKAQEARKREQEQEAIKRAEAKASREKQEIAEREERERQEAEKKAEEEALKPNEKGEVEKKSGIGWGGLLLGGVLLVATGGAIKYFGNRK